MQFIRQIFQASVTTSHCSLTTLFGLNRTIEDDIQGTFLQYYKSIPIELQLLSAATIDFTDETIQFNVKKAFYGLKVYLRQPKFQKSYLSKASSLLSVLVQTVC